MNPIAVATRLEPLPVALTALAVAVTRASRSSRVAPSGGPGLYWPTPKADRALHPPAACPCEWCAPA